MKTLYPALAFVLLLFFSVAHAVDPDTSPQETKPSDLQRSEPDGAPQPFPEQIIVGVVSGSDDEPVAGVAIKLFADGSLVEISHTTSAGDYEMPLPLRIDKDESVVIWFIDSSGMYPPQNVLIKKSSRAEQAGLFSKCARDAKMRPQMRLDVKLMNDSELIASYVSRGCL